MKQYHNHIDQDKVDSELNQGVKNIYNKLRTHTQTNKYTHMHT